jgi:hypothetical protein
MGTLRSRWEYRFLTSELQNGLMAPNRGVGRWKYCNVDDKAMLGNDSVKKQRKRSDRCYAMVQYTGVNNGGEDVFCGRCGGYITSMKTVPHNRETTEWHLRSQPVQFSSSLKCYKIVRPRKGQINKALNKHSTSCHVTRQHVTIFTRTMLECTDKGMVRSDISKPALIFFFHCKSTHNKIHCQNSSC